MHGNDVRRSFFGGRVGILAEERHPFVRERGEVILYLSDKRFLAE